MCQCKQCNGEMKKTKIGGNSVIHILGSVIIFVIGLFTLVTFWPLGIILILIVAFSGAGNKRKKIMLCSDCGYHFERV